MISWQTKHFIELNTIELYAIMRLRLEIFSVEQNCSYQDADGKDKEAYHLMGHNEKGELLAYARIIPAGITFKEVSIGRVVTSSKVRRTGMGKELMDRSLQFIHEKFGKTPVRIGAQCYLTKFYGDLGFVIDGKEYLEDNIPHIEMLKQL